MSWHAVTSARVSRRRLIAACITLAEIGASINIAKPTPPTLASIFNKRPSNSKKTLISISETFTDYTGYKPIEIAKERNKTNSELNIYIPEKWEW